MLLNGVVTLVRETQMQCISNRARKKKEKNNEQFHTLLDNQHERETLVNDSFLYE